MPRPPADPAYSTTRLFSRLWRGYLRKHFGWILIAAVLMVVEGSTLGILSYTLQPLFDRVMVARDGDFIWVVGGGIFLLFVIRAITGVVQQVILSRVAQRSVTEMQVDLVGHLLRLDSLFFQLNAPGALMERVQGDTQAVQNVWQVLIRGVGRDIVALASLAVVAIAIDPVWTLAALVGIPLLVLPSLAVQRYVRRKTGQLRATAADRSTQLDEIFHGINPIKLNLMESYQLARFETIVDRIVRAEVRTAAGRAMLPGLIDVMTGLGFFLVLILGGQEIIAGEKTVGQFMSFFTAMALAFQPLRRLASLAGVFQVAAASLERLYRLFDTAPTILSPGAGEGPDGYDVVLEDVRLDYTGQPVLNGLSLRAEAGKTTALVGASGAGKSTVFNVITRLVEPQSGRITLGGREISSIPLPALRGTFSVVTQDALLFDESLVDNILLGREDIPEERLRAAVEAAYLTEVVAAMPEGLQTRAGPRGSSLSGGQRQRVAIARAILRDAPVLLLDEATSALDAQSEAAVQSALERLSEGRTTLVIAHRLSTVRNADKIVVMDKGRAVDEGTHEELLARGGLYAELYQLQFSDES